jgi:hypothetical protein
MGRENEENNPKIEAFINKCHINMTLMAIYNQETLFTKRRRPSSKVKDFFKP